LETETLLKLVEHPNIVALKEASGDLSQMEEVINSVPDDFSVLVGDDGLMFEFGKLNGDGLVSVASNIIPSEMKTFVDDCLEGNIAKAENFQKKYKEFFGACFIETNPQPIKTLMAKAGYCEEVFRLPMVTMEPQNKDKLINIYKSL
jgi:4-hydroxy-tetrahydrodipicolinate synthase